MPVLQAAMNQTLVETLKVADCVYQLARFPSVTMLVVQLLLPVLLSPLALAAPPSYPSSTPKCKAIPGKPGWPSLAEWHKLNASLAGRLIDPVPPGAVCHPAQKTFDKAQCAVVAKQWLVSDYHAKNPVSFDYNDDSCFPNASAPCVTNGYAAYVVNASSAADVKKGVDFARENNVRLIVKGTGHDFNGRSQAPFSLSIWTHHMQGTQFYSSFKPQGCSSAKGQPAIKIMAGMQMRDIQAAANKQNVMVVGGADPDVGIGGFLLNGGHSPISAQYGLAADQALEFEVVSAAGDVLTVNECNSPDLFWALRGGGPSFAVLVSVTVRTYPSLPVTSYSFSLSTTGNTPTYWNATAYFHSQLEHLSNGGVMGYYFCFSRFPGAQDQAGKGKIFSTFILLNKTAAEANAVFQPLQTYFGADPLPDKVHLANTTAHYRSFYAWWARAIQPGSVGIDGRLGSRLLPAAALARSQAALAAALQQSSPSKTDVLLGHLVANPGVRAVVPAGGADAVLPAWRKAVVHVVLPAIWPLDDAKAKAAATKQLTHSRVAALRRIAPHSGAYVNEADPAEPHWQHAFWGAHYARLAEIKQRWDPRGVFYCFPCVGAEGWAVMAGGRLCRAG